jgi:hypothetical protein
MTHTPPDPADRTPRQRLDALASRLERAIKFMDRPHSPATDEVRAVIAALRARDILA